MKAKKNSAAVIEPVYDICLIKDCGCPQYSRGLCNSCYSAARAAIKESGGTWDQLISQGLAKPAAKTGRKTKTARQQVFLNALSK